MWTYLMVVNKEDHRPIPVKKIIFQKGYGVRKLMKNFRAKTWTKIALNFLNYYWKKLETVAGIDEAIKRSNSAKPLSKFPPMRVSQPLTSRMVVFIPRIESSNATFPPKRLFHTWPMSKTAAYFTADAYVMVAMVMPQLAPCYEHIVLAHDVLI